MRYGLSVSCLRGFSPPETMAAIRATGFCMIEVSADDPKWWDESANLPDSLAREGIAISSVHAGQVSWDMAAPDAAERRRAVDDLDRACRMAAALGIDLVICHCNGPKSRYAVEDYVPNVGRSRQSLELAAERADQIGIRLAVETMLARGERRPGNHVGELLGMIDGLGGHVGICLDTGHTNTSGQDVAGEIAAAGSKLFATHLQDNFGEPGSDPHLLPGCGNIGWDSVLGALDKLGFAGPRTIEVSLESAEAPAELTLRRLAEIRRQWEARS